ncbi:hypothetical protein Aph01nite_75210 [Acrocarpospora phusangensis]|uniref:Cytochrome P450 n=2 Tax=Acrocarpospora phusangensis TaxID=1070424 RepID=A0A919QJZ6_9ACTN|nr:hypothetical protein Aph01nite_75210 [Acrocarpospora phusangensis]
MVNGAGLPLGLVENAAQSIVQIIRHLLGREDGVREAAVAAARADEPFDGYAWEALRFAPFNPLIFRFCERDHRLASGALIKAGTPVFACTSSAGMDADAVEAPEEFRIDRPDHVRLHFGFGAHECVGKHVGVAVIPEVVRRVLRRPGAALLPNTTIDFAGGPFPRRFPIALSSHAAPTHPITTPDAAPARPTATPDAAPARPIATPDAAPASSTPATDAPFTRRVTTTDADPASPDTTSNAAPARPITTPNAAPAPSTPATDAPFTRRVTTTDADPASPDTTSNAAPARPITTPNAAPASSTPTTDAPPARRVTTTDADPASTDTTSGGPTNPRTVPGGPVPHAREAS